MNARRVDDRPVVAELGRPETPQETADRKATASAKRRANQTVLNLVLAIVASLGIVLFLVTVVVRPSATTGPTPVDYAAVAAQAQPSIATKLIVPKLPTGWSANRAQYDDSAKDGVITWSIGLLSPATQYLGLTEGIKGNPSWVATQLANAASTGDVVYGGFRWQIYDQRTAKNPGNLAYALVTTVGDITVVLSGTAPDADFQTVAEAVSTELNS